MTIKHLVFAASALAVMSAAPLAQAETVTTQTYVKPANMPHLKEVDFTVFDINRDGIFTMAEVGERLFQSFDKDSNGYIDNMEWDHKAVMTITPMKKETFKYVDYDDDGLVERSTYTYETFYTASGLTRFDANANGLSAKEFIDTGYRKLDSDDDNLISLHEWKEAYLDERRTQDEPENYNN